MKKLNPRETLILIVTLTLALFFVVYQFVIKPMHEGSVDIDDRLRVEEARLVKAREVLSQRKMIDARYQRLVDLVGLVGADETEMPMIVSRVESSARDSNVHIANIQPQATSVEKEVKFLAVEVDVDGQWLDIIKFLSMLQQPPDYYFINELNLEKYSDATNSLRGRLVISRMSLLNP